MDQNDSLGNVHAQAEQTSDDILEGETSATLPTRRGPSRGPVALPGGKKRLVTTNELGQPNGSDVDSMAFKTAIGVNTRKYIPIAYKTFHLVESKYYEKVLDVLQENFDCEGVSAEYLRDRVNQAWKNHRHNLHKKYIKGKVVAVVRNSPPPPFVNREEWLWFLDYTSKDAYKAASRRNAANRSKLKAPNTLGRRTMAAIRHMIAKERNLKSDFEVGRAEVYIRAHTKKDKTVQCPELIKKIQEIASSNPQSNILSANDVLTQVLGKDRSGHMRGMGAGISITMVKKTSTLLKKNEVLQAENSATNLKVDMLGKELETIKEMILKSQVTPPGGCNIDISTPIAPSKHSSQPGHPFLNKQYDMYTVGGTLVGSGEVVEVDPQAIVHGKALGEGSYKILLTDVHDKNAMLFFPICGAETLGEVGANGYVAWPVAFLKVAN